MSIFISPHCDDSELFGAFTLLREKPLVVVVFDGYVQAARGLPVTWEQRRRETKRACAILGCEVQFLGFRDDDLGVTSHKISSRIGEIIGGFRSSLPKWAVDGRRLFAPAMEMGGHHQHNMVAEAVPNDSNVTRYLTYTSAGKSTSANPVPILDGAWIGAKLRALACYESQHNLDPRMGCHPHFMRGLEEYYL